jgi:hypothetical protein
MGQCLAGDIHWENKSWLVVEKIAGQGLRNS